jgi:general secretion pathway protein A
VIHGYSRGIPRLINIICDFIMLSAFAEEVRSVSLDMVRDIIGDLDFENHYWGSHAVAGPGKGRPARPDQPQEAQPFMLDLAQRIETVEKEFALRVPAALKDICDSLVLLKEELSTRLGRCEAQVSGLNGRLATVANEERRELPTLPSPGAGVGFVRRLFGGADSQ